MHAAHAAPARCQTKTARSGARYYSSFTARWLSPDWAANATAVPYAEFGDPQSLNLYGYVRNHPSTTSDADGHCDGALDCGTQFFAGAANAYGSDNLLGAGRIESNDSGYKAGQVVGDAVATIQGIQEIATGIGGEVGGLGLDATGVGALAGVPVGIVSAGLVAHGATTAGIGGANLFRAGTSGSGEFKPQSSTPAREAYKRPSGSTTPEQRANAQGKPCSKCGQTEPQMKANHKDPLVKQHYRDGKIDTQKMRDPSATNSHCTHCSASQGGHASKYSKEMKKKIKANGN
jgi:RHS repeat-associated protein